MYINVTGVDDAWTWSNLGGLGPDNDPGVPPTIRRSHVTTFKGVAVDLVISNLTEYVPKATQWNGVSQEFGAINLAGTNVPAEDEDEVSRTEVRLRFTFVEHGTNTPYVLPKFRMAFFDFDTGAGGNGVECLGVDTEYVTSYSMHPETELVPSS